MTLPFTKLSVILPVYNEERTVRTIVERLRQVDLPMEILAVNDGSSDGTAAVLASLHQ